MRGKDIRGAFPKGLEHNRMTRQVKTYVFDLDNTLCKTDGSNYIDSTPYVDRIKKVNMLHDQGHIIIIETARGCVSGKKWFTQTMDQLKFKI